MGIYIYIIIFIISIYVAFFRNFFSENLRKYCDFVSAIPVFILSAIRYDVGTDYFYAYVPIFEKVKSQDFFYYIKENNAELGYSLLNKVILQFSDNVQWAFVICSAIYCYFIFKYIYEQSPNYCYSILLIFIELSYFRSMNYMRQGIACAIFLYSTKYILENNWKKYFLLISIAISFHWAAIIYIPIFFVNKFKLKNTFMYFVLVLAYLGKDYMRLLLNKILIGSKYERYFGSSLDDGALNLKVAIIACIIFIIATIFRKYNDKKYNFYLNLLFIYTLICISSKVIPNADRMIHLFTDLYIVFIPYIFSKIQDKRLRILLYFTITMIFVGQLYMDIIIGNQHEVLPYKTIFDK